MISVEKVAEICNKIQAEIGKVVIGYHEIIEDFLVCLTARGHMLLEGVPGIAKTTLAKTFTEVTGLNYRRIQFTQDLLPADITGHYYFNQHTNKFELRKGPLFAELILADEINRAPPKTQSALLEAMEELQVTIEGTTLKLPEPFMVIATLNPVEIEGVYPLPEAQVDRFMYKSKMNYIEPKGELKMLMIKAQSDPKSHYKIEYKVDSNFIRELSRLRAQVYIHKSLLRYIRDIILATRNRSELTLGASPRAGEYMVYAAQAYALIHGRDFVLPDDIKSVAPKILNHRLILSVDAELEGLTTESLIDNILTEVPVPKGSTGY